MDIGGQGDGTRNARAGVFRRIHDFGHSLIQNAVIVSLELDSDTIAADSRHSSLLHSQENIPVGPDPCPSAQKTKRQKPPCGHHPGAAATFAVLFRESLAAKPAVSAFITNAKITQR
jgi:hypothetical protein